MDQVPTSASNWSPVAILPNLSTRRAVGCDVAAFASCRDPRVQAFCAVQPKFKEFLSRFTDAFRVPLQPIVFIVCDDVRPKLAKSSALVSFRDLIAMCVIPYARSLNLVYRTGYRITYSNSFWLYPWMLDRYNEHLIARTPAFLGFHTVEEFHGQSSPELSVMELEDLDEVLFEELLSRWKRHFLGKRQRWEDRALFRSLNMATQAAQLPAGVDATLYDFGRMSALWVSAFEILAHSRTKKSNPRCVYPLLERICYLEPRVGQRKYAAYQNWDLKKKPWPRRPLPCWLYGKLYQARCDFLHGNRLGPKPLNPRGLKVDLVSLAPLLYRLALIGFLRLPTLPKLRKSASGAEAISEYLSARALLQDYQGSTERALLKSRKEPAQSRHPPQRSFGERILG